MAKKPIFILILLLGFVIITACSDSNESANVGNSKVFFCSVIFDNTDDTNAIVNVYVDDKLIGTLTESGDENLINHHFIANNGRNSSFGVVYVMDKEFISYRLEAIIHNECYIGEGYVNIPYYFLGESTTIIKHNLP